MIQERLPAVEDYFDVTGADVGVPLSEENSLSQNGFSDRQVKVFYVKRGEST